MPEPAQPKTLTPKQKKCEGYAYRLRAKGHLFEAEDESQEWPDLHAAIREARKAYQANGTMPDSEGIGTLASGVRSAV